MHVVTLLKDVYAMKSFICLYIHAYNMCSSSLFDFRQLVYFVRPWSARPKTSVFDKIEAFIYYGMNIRNIHLYYRQNVRDCLFVVGRTL